MKSSYVAARGLAPAPFIVTINGPCLGPIFTDLQCCDERNDRDDDIKKPEDRDPARL